MKNYSKEDHLKSRELEKKFYEQYKNYLIWNNENWNETDTYDSSKEDLGDFTIQGTNWKIELQQMNFDDGWVYVFGRRLFEVDNVRGTYGAVKDVSKTIQIAYDGKRVDWIELKDFDWSIKFDDFAGKRAAWETCYGIHVDKMKKGNFGSYLLMKKINAYNENLQSPMFKQHVDNKN